MESKVNILTIKKYEAEVQAAKSAARAAQRMVDVKKAEIALLKTINRQLLNSVYDLRQQLKDYE